MSEWAIVVDEIRNGNVDAEQGLYTAVSTCARLRLFHYVDPQVVDDHVQEILMIVLAAIRSGELRDPARLMGFVRTVTRRQVAAHIRGSIHRRRRLVRVDSTVVAAPSDQSPEARMALQQQIAAACNVLEKLCSRDREILLRFYYHEQDSEQICSEMGLTGTQFRLYKSRALAKCCDLADRGVHSTPHSTPHSAPHSTRPLRIA